MDGRVWESGSVVCYDAETGGGDGGVGRGSQVWEGRSPPALWLAVVAGSGPGY